MRIYENDFYLDSFIRDENTNKLHDFDNSGNQGYRYDHDYEHPEQCESCHTSHINANRQYVFTRKGISILIICCLIVSALFGSGGAFLAAHFVEPTHHTFGSPPMRFAPMYHDLADATGSRLSVQEVINVASPSVVEITSERSRRIGFMMEHGRGAGSGAIISTDGFIITNSHVVEDAQEIRVTLADGTRHDARIVGLDRANDVAVIKIGATGLTPVIFGDSDNIVVGDLAVVIGNPLGELGGSSTAGIISALNRTITIENRNLTLIQTDASINQGNSGGGLFNQHGEMIGLIVAKSYGPGVEGIGFAIPINIAKPIAMNIMENMPATGRPQIGIEMVDISDPEVIEAQGLRFPGIYISRVTSQNAINAGLMPGDMLHYVAGVQIRSFEDVTSVVQSHNVGDVIEVTVIRGLEILTFYVKLSERFGS